jgi:hypothetical protein
MLRLQPRELANVAAALGLTQKTLRRWDRELPSAPWAPSPTPALTQL